MAETEIYSPIQVEASNMGARLFRNHVAGFKVGDRYQKSGLAPGSADLIGWTSDGRFLSVEVKPEGWKPTPKWQKSRQKKWMDAVQKNGGVAMVVTSVDEFVSGLRQERQASHTL